MSLIKAKNKLWLETLFALQQIDTPGDTHKKKSRLRDADINAKEKRLRDLWNGTKI